MNLVCPCGSTRNYSDCCEPIIAGQKEASTSLELMRSRYVAFTQANTAYLILSHHSKTRSASQYKGTKEWAKSVQWMGLVILGTQAGEATDDVGYVEFKALFLESGQMQQIHEKSLFKREEQRWVYDSGVHY